MTRIIIGGGAAGVFGAIAAADGNSDETILLESSGRLLAKVEISGGGRCNVTHHCFEPKELIKAYPRGSRELLGPFSRFQPQHTVDWFQSRGVPLKIESDGRIFPTSDQSRTIIDCLQSELKRTGVRIRHHAKVRKISRDENEFHLELDGEERIRCESLLLATGGSRTGYELAKSLGHTITPLAPSLFTFEIPDPQLHLLSGTSFSEVTLKLTVGDSGKFESRGPLLITHWGLSGPAVLRLSAIAARELAASDYRATVIINWTGTKTVQECLNALKNIRSETPGQQIGAHPQFGLTRKFWAYLLEAMEIEPSLTYHNIGNRLIQGLAEKLCRTTLQINGKGIFKDEFVTCGGVALSEVNFRTMESRIAPGCYFAGEVLDIDGITGGFNFQNAWTTGWIAGNSMREVHATGN